MIVPYLPIIGSQPIPSLGGSLTRYRPVMAVRITGPRDTRLREGLLDTGADDTVFEDTIAASSVSISPRRLSARSVWLADRTPCAADLPR